MSNQTSVGSRQLLVRTVHRASDKTDARQKMSYRNQQAFIRGKFASIEALACNQILDTVELGVLYPILSLDWSPEEGSADHCEILKDDFYHPDLFMMQGLFREVKRIEPASAREKIPSIPSTYIVLGYKFIEIEKSLTTVLVNTWRDWTGARYIYLNLKSEFDMRRIVFFQRLSPRSEIDLFTYLVLVEVENVTQHNSQRLVDFVQSMRTRKMPGYVSIYRESRPFDLEKRCCYNRKRQVATMVQSPREWSGLPSRVDIIVPVDPISERLSDDENEEDDPFFIRQVTRLEEAMSLVEPANNPVERQQALRLTTKPELCRQSSQESSLSLVKPVLKMAANPDWSLDEETAGGSRSDSSRASPAVFVEPCPMFEIMTKKQDFEEEGRFASSFGDNIRSCLTFQTRQ